MKIYNEIVIDMNPESSSYGETLHEDSYEYNGEMMLMGFFTDYFGQTSGGGSAPPPVAKEIETWMNNRQSSDSLIVNGKYYYWDTSSNRYQEAGIEGAPTVQEIQARGGSFAQFNPRDTEIFRGGELGVTGEFEPSFEQFKTSLQTRGDYGQMESGFELEEGELGEFEDKPLKFIERGFDIGMAGIGIEKRGIESQKTALGSSIGQSLYDVKQQTDIATSKSGLAFSGQIAEQEKRKRTGVMGDYTQQRDELALGMEDLGLRRQELALDKEQDVEAFWRQKYEELYSDVDEYEGAVGA